MLDTEECQFGPKCSNWNLKSATNDAEFGSKRSDSKRHIQTMPHREPSPPHLLERVTPSW